MRGREAVRVNEWDMRFAQEGALWGEEPSVGARFAFDYFAKKGARAMLDVACGYGRDSVYLAKKFEVTGIDASIEGLRMANERALHEKVAARFVLGDVRIMPFVPGSFDAVLCNGILAHFLRDERSLAAGEIERVLKKGGALVVSEFSANKTPTGEMEIDLDKAGEKNSYRHLGRWAHHFFSKGELQMLFAGIAFEVEEEHEELSKHGGEPMLKWVLAGVKK